MTRTNDLRQELRHAVFLQRAADLAPTSAEARLGQGAFLALRFVDLLAPGLDVEADAFRYQHAATERYCREISGGSAEAAHLLGLVDSSMAAGQSGDVGHVVPGMLAYAHYLEDAGHYDEALDVLDALARVGGGRLGAADAVALALRVARVNRKLARFDAADAAYGEAGSRAAAAGDVLSRLLSRIGQANTALGRGNLAGAEASYREILADARTARFREAEARTEHGLGGTLQMRGDAGEGLRHIWRAFELYEDESSRMRALNDAAILLLALGHAGAAERALLKVLRHASHADNRHNALIELMHCASFRRDQVGFQRWHGE
ncbi:MAG TPA: hypothetical protein VFK78_03105, partial [Gemmatimonadales bacterium]|nr:hypothetical protein [Gemmatimonadales bacterium]